MVGKKKAARKSSVKKKSVARRAWSASDDKTLKKMARERQTAEHIAKLLDRSKHAIYLRGSEKKIRFKGRASKAKK